MTSTSFWELFIYSFFGWLVLSLFNLNATRKMLPNFKRKYQLLIAYWNINWIYLIATLIIIVFLTLIVRDNDLNTFVSLFGFTVVDSVASKKAFLFFVGVFLEVIGNTARRNISELSASKIAKVTQKLSVKPTVTQNTVIEQDN